ncbi:Transcriptional regulatory protein, C terminal [Paractinoplanes atraurantiacus]|uniref:Transcriptional regulatory protein, C terminal n=2 Tax=Paractinoplanes atraurantiacus TaxID=1036182 RepID=A0A285GRM9_9ACTN|nr:Transcriptional regulatory protein, C terminal [Actinoplanes atraurantiacus]
MELDAGPRQQAYLLALLLARPGRPVSTNELVDLIWSDDAPASSLNVIHKYIGSLRHILEPGLAARKAGSHLIRRGSGYLFEVGPAVLDLVTFRDLVGRAGAELAAGRPDAALERYQSALRLWQGPAGDGLTGRPDAMAIFAGLNNEFFDACVEAAGLAVRMGRPESVLAPLHLAASMAPLHELVQASLVTTLGAAGRPAQAVSLFGAVRARLSDELGIDPGQRLQQAYLRVLNQPVTDAPAPETPATPIGRAAELAVLDRALAAATSGGSALVVVQGEPGAGKTSLLEEAAARARKAGALVVWGRCMDSDGTPAMWPWTQVVGAVLDELPTAVPGLDRLMGSLGEGGRPDSGARFRLFEQVVAFITQAAAGRPIMVVVDDLHWADPCSLELFSHLAASSPAATVILGALRDRAPKPAPALARMLAAVARRPDHRRIRLGPLGPADVAELVRRETGREPAGDDIRRLHARTAGNPFLVRELSRWPDTQAGVPSTVRDVVRDRMAGLDESTRSLVRTAALIGEQGDIGLLARAAGVDVKACLDRLEVLEGLALLGPVRTDPYSFRFRHGLVRESVAASTPLRQLTRLHLSIAEALDDGRQALGSAAERLAHHLWSAGPLGIHSSSRSAA